MKIPVSSTQSSLEKKYAILGVGCNRYMRVGDVNHLYVVRSQDLLSTAEGSLSFAYSPLTRMSENNARPKRSQSFFTPL